MSNYKSILNYASPKTIKKAYQKKLLNKKQYQNVLRYSIDNNRKPNSLNNKLFMSQKV